MLRKTPLNFLATVSIAAVLWVLTGLFLGNYLGENVSLQQMTVEEFLATYRIITVVASALGLAIACFWFVRGGTKAAATDPLRFRRLWVGLEITQVMVALLSLVALVVMTLSESLTIANFSIILAGLLSTTAVFFWITTLAMSPIHVMVTVPGYR